MIDLTNLAVDIHNNSFQLNDFPPITLPKCKGLLILNFLSKNIDKQFSPTNLRMNIENTQDVKFLQQDEFSCLIDQACDYIPATDRQTIKEVIKELKSNATALLIAKEACDESLVEELLEQDEMLLDYLYNAMNFNHTIKNINMAKTNNNRSVKRALKNLLKYIEEQNPELAKIIDSHLIINSSHVCLLSKGA